MNPISSPWPVCGSCCEVAWFPWLGGPHHCVVAEPEEPDPDAPVAAVPVAADDLRQLLEVMLEEAVAEVEAGRGATLEVTLFDDGGLQLCGDGLRIGGRCEQTVVAAQSLFARHEVDFCRDGYVWHRRSNRGLPGTLERGQQASSTETRVRCWLNPSTTIDSEHLTRRSQELAFLNPGLTTRVIDEPNQKDRTFRYPDGLVDFVRFVNRIRIPIHPSIVHFRAEAPGTTVEVALQWNAGFSESVHIYVNSCRADDTDIRCEGFRSALRTVASSYAKEHKLLRATEPDLFQSEIGEGLAAVVSVKTAEQKSVEAICVEYLTSWFDANPVEAGIILDKAISSSDAARMPRISCRGGIA